MAEGQEILVPTSIGELIDKITILSIKREKILDEAKRANVLTELDRLMERAMEHKIDHLLASAEGNRLREVNLALWEVEDDIRAHEKQADFGPSFIALARSVYRLNDERSRLKRAMNIAAGSLLVEEKSFD